METLDDILQALWQDYERLNPQAEAIHRLLAERGERVRNDHIALRTFDDPRLGLDVLAAPFVRFGYTFGEAYAFPEKKLVARHYEPPDSSHPKLFLSALRTGEFSPSFRAIVARLEDEVPRDAPARLDFAVSGRLWRVSIAEYETLGAESEYTAWLAAFGFRANHFTVDAGALRTFGDLRELDDFLETSGFALNEVGGKIKGSAAEGLEQSATLAAEVDVAFEDGVRRIPGCYYEFARRHVMPDGRRFSGFVPRSADKIFHSTDRR